MSISHDQKQVDNLMVLLVPGHESILLARYYEKLTLIKGVRHHFFNKPSRIGTRLKVFYLKLFKYYKILQQYIDNRMD